MIKPGDTYIVTNDDIEKIKLFIRQTDGTRLSKKQSDKLIEVLSNNRINSEKNTNVGG